MALGGRAILLAGPSGSGKSSLALEMMAAGAGLVADDMVALFVRDGLRARAPEGLPAAIEARGLGLIPATLVPDAPVIAACDMTQRSTTRMPHPQTISLLGQPIPLLHRPASGPVASMLVQYLKAAPR
ncbi:MAG: serine kinase [Pseudomonadota bacterium]